jgi:hypothetical protein
VIVDTKILLARLTIIPFLICSIPLWVVCTIISVLNFLVVTLERPLFWYIRNTFGQNMAPKKTAYWRLCLDCLQWYATGNKQEIENCEKAWKLLRDQRGEK